MGIARDLRDLIGRTPVLELARLFPSSPCRVLAKLEQMNPMSVKDRAVLSMIHGALDRGDIVPGTEVVEASSGNTAIAVASLAAIFGYRTRIYMSEQCGPERQRLLTAFGAAVVLTPADEHTKGARARALAYCARHPRTTFFLNQHANPDNASAHVRTTGPELWEQAEGRLDALVVGLGTAGTYEGLSTFLKSKNPSIRIIGFEPWASPVYSGGAQGEHHLIGIGPGFVTENFERARRNLDELILVREEDAYEAVRRIARTEGLLVGPSSGAAAHVAGQVAARPEFSGRTVACLFYDTGERYLSESRLFLADGVERED